MPMNCLHPLLRLSCTTLLALPMAAQFEGHLGRVHIGNGRWVDASAAESKGFFRYEDRWLPAKYKRKIKKWRRADAKVSSWKDAYRHRSKHYHIRTNAPRHIVELEIGPFMDELYRLYVTVFAEDFGLKGKGANNQQINIYWGFEAYRDEVGRDRSNPGFYVSNGVLNVLYDPADPDGFFKTVFHEGAHQFFAAMLPGAELPHWLNEALAVYMEGCTFSPTTGKVTRGHVAATRLRFARDTISKRLEAGQPVDPRKLFMDVSRESFHAREYALSWSFVYFLVHREEGKRKKAFFKFLKAMNGSGNKPVNEVWRKANKEDLAEVEKGWAQFIMDLKQPEPTQHYLISPAGGGSELRKNDQLLLVDGHLIETGSDYDTHVRGRKKSQPMRVVVRRKTQRKGPMSYVWKLVVIDVPAGEEFEFKRNGFVPFTKSFVL